MGAGLLFHFFAVECRCLYFLYISVMFQIVLGTRSIFLSLRSTANGNQWCMQNECMKTMTETMQCVNQGIFEAMRSTDLSYENPQICVKFHGDNVLFGFVLVPTLLLSTLLAISLIELFRNGLHKFTALKYLAFTSYMHSLTISRVVIALGAVYLVCLIFSIPTMILIVIPRSVLDGVDTTRWALLETTLKACLPAYVAILVSTYGLVTGKTYALKFSFSDIGQDFEIRRTWMQLLTQTNPECRQSLERALLQASFGNKKPLEDLLMDPTCLPDFTKHMKECCPDPATKEWLPVRDTDSS